MTHAKHARKEKPCGHGDNEKQHELGLRVHGSEKRQAGVNGTRGALTAYPRVHPSQMMEREGSNGR
jgi:hypothetical protein